MFPRTRHRYQLSELVSLLGNLRNGDGTPPIVEVRTVAARGGNEQWFNLGTTVRLIHERDWNPAPTTIGMDGVLLLSQTTPAERISSVEDLCGLITQWRKEVGTGHNFPFQQDVSITHYSARNRWIQTPGWVCDLYEQDPDRGNYSGPSGPFLYSPHNIFAESIEALAVEWLRLPGETSQSSLRHSYQVIVPDHRGQIDDIHVAEDSITVSIHTGSSQDVGPLFCASKVVVSGEISRLVKKVEDGSATFDFPDSATEVAFWLLTAEGEWLDHYSENQFSTAPSFSALAQPRLEDDPAFTQLQDALASGETNQIEFKPYIKITRGNDKAEEILKAVIAFSNSGGGVLYIGINDDVEPIGVDPAIKKDYAGECHGSDTEMEQAYVRDLRKLISEGVDPNPVFTPEWTSFAHHRILKIHVRRGANRPYALASSGDIFVRTGANNRKLRQADYPRYFSEAQAPSRLDWGGNPLGRRGKTPY
jgi:hypothetical protein